MLNMLKVPVEKKLKYEEKIEYFNVKNGPMKYEIEILRKRKKNHCHCINFYCYLTN